MLKIVKKLSSPAAIAPVLKKRARQVVLPFAERSKSRLKIVLSDGTEAGLLLPRGTPLRGGDVLVDEQGGLIEVLAAAEEVYRVVAGARQADPAFALLRAAYHLGNRHIPVQLETGALILERDPVLRDLLLRLGMQVEEVIASFEPEAGAYGGGHRHDQDEDGGSLGEQLSIEAHRHDAPCSHDHGPADSHGHDHGHEHEHEHEHSHDHGHVHDAHCGHEHGTPLNQGLKFAPVPRRRP